MSGGVPELEFDPFLVRSRADFDNTGRELDADGLGGEDAPFVADEPVKQTGPVKVKSSQSDVELTRELDGEELRNKGKRTCRSLRGREE